MALSKNFVQIMECIFAFNPPGLVDFFNGFGHAAVLFRIKDPDMMELLLRPRSEFKLDVDARLGGDTRLNVACREGEFQIISLLAHHGADLNHIGSDGLSPLVELITHHGNRLGMVKLLVSLGAGDTNSEPDFREFGQVVPESTAMSENCLDVSPFPLFNFYEKAPLPGKDICD